MKDTKFLVMEMYEKRLYVTIIEGSRISQFRFKRTISRRRIGTNYSYSFVKIFNNASYFMSDTLLLTL